MSARSPEQSRRLSDPVSPNCPLSIAQPLGPLTSWLAIWPLPTMYHQHSGRVSHWLISSHTQPEAALAGPILGSLSLSHLASWRDLPSPLPPPCFWFQPLPSFDPSLQWVLSGHTPPPSTGNVLPGEPTCLRYQILLPSPCFSQPQPQGPSCTPQSWNLPLQIPGPSPPVLMLSFCNFTAAPSCHAPCSWWHYIHSSIPRWCLLPAPPQLISVSYCT